MRQKHRWGVGGGGSVRSQVDTLLRLEQWSPPLLVPGICFVEDNFSMDGDGVGWEWVMGMVQAVMQSMGSGR